MTTCSQIMCLLWSVAVVVWDDSQCTLMQLTRQSAHKILLLISLVWCQQYHIGDMEARTDGVWECRWGAGLLRRQECTEQVIQAQTLLRACH